MFFTTGTALQAAIDALPASKKGSFVAFDAHFYATEYMGTYTGTLSPIEHFVQIGAVLNYAPNGVFDPNYYASQYSDLQGKGYDAADLLIHFLRFGLDEGRVANPSLAAFDGTAYLLHNADVLAYVQANLAQFGGNLTNGAIAHYVKFGANEGRDATFVSSGTFTLVEVVKPAVAPTPDITAVYWGYNPHDHEDGGGTGDPAPSDGGIPVADLVSFLTSITGLDLHELGLIDANGVDPFQNVTSLTLSNPLTSTSTTSGNNNDAETVLRIEFVGGTFLNAEVALGEAYFAFLNNLLFDEQGNSRLFEKVIVEGTPGSDETLKHIVLTPTQNNGGTVEVGLPKTTGGDDTIVAGRLDLLHGAYIDGGLGYNILEVDAKGTYAQPLQLLNIQEVRVNDLPNFYTDPQDAYAGGYLRDSTYPYLADGSGGNDDSWLDLSRATKIQKLVVTDESPDSGNLTIVGIRNNATTRLEGGFSDTLTLAYGAQGAQPVNAPGALHLELVVGTVTGTLNLLNNASVLTIDSIGYENYLEQFFAGGNISRMIITGEAVFGAAHDIGGSFNSGRPAIVDASGNTGGLDITLNEHYNVMITGTQADDEITAQDSGTVVIVAGNGNNVIDADGSTAVSITTGSGNDNISATDGKNVTIVAGDGKNVIDTDGSVKVDITTGTGNDTITSRDGKSVTIDAGAGNNTITTNNAWVYGGGTFYGTSTIDITTGAGNDTISATRAGSVTIDAGAGTNKITVSAHAIDITTGAGNDTLSLSGMNITFDQGDQGEPGWNDWNADNYRDEEHFVDQFAPGALLTLSLGAGSNTINLGRDVTDIDSSPDVDVQYGITALEGSVITGTGIKLFVENNSDLTHADISGATITSVVLKQELRITSQQFTQIGAAAFSAQFDEEGATEDLYIVVSSDVTLASLVDLSQLNPSVRLHFELHNNATLTLTAEQLHKYVGWHGIDSSDGLNGKVVITDAGPHFNAFDNGNDYQVIDAGSLSGSFFGSDDVTIIRSPSGFDRPAPEDSTDTTVIDSTGVATLTITADIVIDSGNPTTLKFIGDGDIVFAPGVTVNLGDGTDAGNAIDFSALDGTITGMTVENFDNIQWIAGNNTGTRIDVGLTGDVGTSSQGLVSSGVETYVVTSIVDNDNDDGDISTDTATFWLCDQTQDVQVIGLQGNAGKTLTFGNVPWGLVHPSILLEGDGYADWNGGLKADGNPNASDIGNVVVNYFTPGAPAVIDINNGGVALGVTSTGGERKFAVGSISVTYAASMDINVTDGDAVIADVNGDSGLKTLDVDATEDVTITAALPTALTKIDASGVLGKFTSTMEGVAGAEAKFTFIGSDAGNTLTLDGSSQLFDAVTGTVINGGAAGATLVIKGDVELDNATLTQINTVTLNNGAELTLTFDQLAAIGASDITVAVTGNTATLHLVGLNEDPFAAADFHVGVGVGIGFITVAEQPVVTLDPTTDLTTIDGLTVPEGTVLNLTAAQFQQLDGAGLIDGLGTVNITGLTQADVDAGLDLSGITTAHIGTITLAENVNLDSGTDLGSFNEIVLADDQVLGLYLDQISAPGSIFSDPVDGLSVHGGTNTTVLIEDTSVGAFTSYDASGLAVSTLKVLNILVDDRDFELIFENLSSDVLAEVYNDLGFVGAIERRMVIDEGTTVPGFMVFNAYTDDTEVRSLELTLRGGVEISDNLRLSTEPKNSDLIPTHFQTLTINSEGTAANLITGETDNVIAGDITSQGVFFLSLDNNLKEVIINATQNLVVEGDIVFESVTAANNWDDGISANDDLNADVTLTITGTADVTVHALDSSDVDIQSVTIANNGTGTFTATGGSPAVFGALEELVLTGTGDIVLGDANPATLAVGVSSETISVIDASGLSGNLNLGEVVDIDSANFAFTSGTGVTLLTLTTDTLDVGPVTDRGGASTSATPLPAASSTWVR